MTTKQAREKYRLFLCAGGRIEDENPIDLRQCLHTETINGEVGYPVCVVPNNIHVSKEIGNTVYDVTADFDTTGKESLFQQFEKLILDNPQI